MKVYIIISYHYLPELDLETCRVDRVYAEEKQALRRKKLLERINTDEHTTYHKITKTCKGFRGFCCNF